MGNVTPGIYRGTGSQEKGIGVQGNDIRATGDAAPEASIRVFLLIENRLLRDALERLFRKRPDLEIVGCGEPGGCSRETPKINSCDVLVLDFFDCGRFPSILGVKDGTEISPKAVLIGMSDETEQFLAAVRAGVAGYLLKEASAAEVVAAVRATFRGEAVCPPKLCAALFQYVARLGQYGMSNTGNGSGKPCLTLRQQKLIGLVAKGLTNKEIGTCLNISEYTVKNHIHRILKNVDAETRGEAVEVVRLRGYTLTVSDNPQDDGEKAHTRLGN